MTNILTQRFNSSGASPDSASSQSVSNDDGSSQSSRPLTRNSARSQQTSSAPRATQAMSSHSVSHPAVVDNKTPHSCGTPMAIHCANDNFANKKPSDDTNFKRCQWLVFNYHSFHSNCIQTRNGANVAICSPNTIKEYVGKNRHQGQIKFTYCCGPRRNAGYA